MIQRIQSLYLFMVALLMVIMLANPLGSFLVGDEEFVLKPFGIFSTGSGELVAGTLYMGCVIAMAAVLPFITIFLYRNRLLQIRLCFMELIFLLGAQIFVVYYLYHATTGIPAAGYDTAIQYSVVDLAPLVSIVLVWLAYKGIVKDEALVRSLNRIR